MAFTDKALLNAEALMHWVDKPCRGRPKILAGTLISGIDDGPASIVGQAEKPQQTRIPYFNSTPGSILATDFNYSTRASSSLSRYLIQHCQLAIYQRTKTGPSTGFQRLINVFLTATHLRKRRYEGVTLDKHPIDRLTSSLRPAQSSDI